ncbi:2-oxoacid:acceptor oxidoreductase subunit alpha [Patescibacteria group bacterium]|nr:2-oxoacid:acceptor oxidoreductase subunit alpha [Patescibacteria group bacterium]
MKHNFNWKIGGPAGYGIKSVGAMFSRVMLRHGLFVFNYDEYPSLIRGGHNAFDVTVSTEPVYTTRRPVSLLVALDQESISEHQHELADDGGVIFNDGPVKVDKNLFPESVKLYPVPFDKIVEEHKGEKVMRNVVSLGASFALLGVPFESVQAIIEYKFKKKEKVVASNVTLAKAGYDFIKENFKEEFGYQLKKLDNPGRMILSGNEGIVWGAIKAGLKFYSAYPMTPSTSILHNLALQAHKYNIVVKHTEDEISAINTAVGAGYAGVRAMTASAGGGFALMAETLGMAAIMEMPLVIAELTRPGPSTGMPTWTGQGDLRFVLHASQDEFPRFVIAPGDVEQCFELTQTAFDIAEKYQTPVIILSDKQLAESYQTIEKFDTRPRKLQRGKVLTEEELSKIDEYKRYNTDVSDGVSPRVLPGTKKGEHLVNSDEHNELGFSEERSDERVRMMDKRFRKVATALEEIPDPELEGDKKADITFVSFGSTRGAILEAMKDLKQDGIKSNFLQIIYLSPFPDKKVGEVFKKAKKVVVVECNKTGQLAGLIREHTGQVPDYKILKYDGRPFFPDEIVDTIKDIL